jgi:hypothetical protein
MKIIFISFITTALLFAFAAALAAIFGVCDED